ncbi:hypothetical protein BDAP_001480 [Binucleata daphniae]
MREIINECYNYDEMYEIDVDGCNFIDSDFLEFIFRFKKLRCIKLANTHILTSPVLAIIDRFATTLRFFDLTNVPIIRFVLDYAEEKLKNCTIIYKNGIRKYID